MRPAAGDPFIRQYLPLAAASRGAMGPERGDEPELHQELAGTESGALAGV